MVGKFFKGSLLVIQCSRLVLVRFYWWSMVKPFFLICNLHQRTFTVRKVALGIGYLELTPAPLSMSRCHWQAWHLVVLGAASMSPVLCMSHQIPQLLLVQLSLVPLYQRHSLCTIMPLGFIIPSTEVQPYLHRSAQCDCTTAVSIWVSHCCKLISNDIQLDPCIIKLFG